MLMVPFFQFLLYANKKTLCRILKFQGLILRFILKRKAFRKRKTRPRRVPSKARFVTRYGFDYSIVLMVTSEG